MTGPFAFQIRSTDGNARSSTLRTPHGPVEMPAFAPVGTAANVKTLEPRDLSELNASLLLANTYHLYLRPGHELIERLGGLHSFMGWDGPILTDSGGYQVFSLAHRRSLDADGVTFRSHIDGSTHRFTAERVIEIQERLGADIVMVLDECADPLDPDYLAQALARTHAWAERCKAAHSRPDQALFGIVQGGIYPELRAASARILTGLDFSGYAIGGLAVGETKEQMYATLDATCEHLPVDRPRYLMGVGAPEDILESVARGVDLFDCVLPTRIARNGTLLTFGGRFNIRNARFAEDSRPIQEECGCYTCRTFSRAYLRHLFISGEISGLRLATIHNLHFMQRLMAQIRAEIGRGTFASFMAGFLQGYRITDQRVRHEQRRLRAEALVSAP